MDIEEFYAEDERRRRSAEIELGADWHDAQGVRYELSWVVDTGELYLMREPGVPLAEDPFGDVFPPGLIGGSVPVEGLTVVVVGYIAEQARVEEVLGGWEDEMGVGDSISWLADRLRGAQIPTRRP